jgi:CheY-like chemotaxis protein
MLPVTLNEGLFGFPVPFQGTEKWGKTLRSWLMTHEKSDQKIKKHLHNETSIGKRVPRILLAEDDYDMRKLLTWSLSKSGYEVIECPDGVHLLDHVRTFFPPAEPEDLDLIISDIRMPGVTGLEVLEGTREYKEFPPMILITAFVDEETHDQARRLGAAAIFDKPFDIDELLAKVREIVPH